MLIRFRPVCFLFFGLCRRLVTFQYKSYLYWFDSYQDLAGTKPLSQLAKKVPIFNRRDDILRVLCEFDVPVNRGVWLIKMTAAYAAAMQVSKDKLHHES